MTISRRVMDDGATVSLEETRVLPHSLEAERAILAKDEAKAIEILRQGAKKANEVASAKLIEAKKAVGVL